MKMQYAPRLKDLLFVLAKKVSLVEVNTFAVLFVPLVTGRVSWTTLSDSTLIGEIHTVMLKQLMTVLTRTSV